MKINKKLIWYSLPILLGGYLIYRQFRRGKDEGQDAPPPAPYVGGGSGTTMPSVSGVYPLRKGSRNSTVGSLQTLLNTALKCQNKTLLVVDNIFGSKTEAALLDLAGKTSVTDSSDFERIKTNLSSACSLSANLDWAWKLIDAQNSGRYNSLMVRQPATFYKVVKDFTGKWVSASPYTELNLPVKSNYSLQDYVLRSATNDGRLRMEIMRGDFAGMWLSKAGIDIPNTFNIS
jgi:hypothetical protein